MELHTIFMGSNENLGVSIQINRCACLIDLKAL